MYAFESFCTYLNLLFIFIFLICYGLNIFIEGKKKNIYIYTVSFFHYIMLFFCYFSASLNFCNPYQYFHWAQQFIFQNIIIINVFFC